MAQREIEKIIGRLATDEEFRVRFRRDAVSTILGLAAEGSPLTRSEIDSLVRLSPETLDSFADALDPRIQKASLRVDTADDTAPPASKG